jgi:ankyrin repeat protein
MYPNPQDALPLPQRPNLEQYRTLAKELVKACRSGDANAVAEWARDWIRRLHASAPVYDRLEDPATLERQARQITHFVLARLTASADPAAYRLTDAQFVIARAHGFLSWPKLAEHLDGLTRAGSPTSAFEQAADAIAQGDLATVRRLLHDRPELIRARSTREHRATLLHYVSANGVENYRQRSPQNIVDITTALLDAGADVNAEADVYGGGADTLGLVATSGPPAQAGVQRGVIDLLLARGARLDATSAGNAHTLVVGCLANGQPEAAAYLADRGAPLGLAGAAGIGRVDALARFYTADGQPGPDVTRTQLLDAFFFASAYGHADTTRFLLDHGTDVSVEMKHHGAGHTALHVASFHGHTDVVSLLLERGANVYVKDKTWGTDPLTWAMTGWQQHGEPSRYYDLVARLVAAGATVTTTLLERDRVQADERMRAALGGAR